MNELFKKYTKDFYSSGDLNEDINQFFTQNGDLRTLKHTLEVAAEAKHIAELYAIDPAKVIKASLLHDISNVIPISTMLDVAKELSIEILDEEHKYDRSVHQKLSKYMAQDIFGITDYEILNAIESHTTHKANASMTDKILFVSDKISWKLPGDHPYLQEMRIKVNELEIDKAILIYLNNIWDQRDKLKLVHPWLIKAREELMENVSRGH
ncbi:bis(5'-nucleosyl)-tetraphosphatase (symmetrical) YqeK [Cohnella silvisoli]|uniref:Bis(5'-nucleosyl)-tetraphosphatase (Symmetrical) YqeK n=1 Tax=Cohnella silvisoli TaxID=2873699 RepID=A0ABV1L1D1_9BACL|nr:bis(5'-nucleosyl)-tetraphosphatase (symmetrical) YqeK [Cohnella silvisoli]MCD9025459.1 bis(5'-nucleosyl)-tetraphosphatase (symmetrical) YqeK [Cohnella silvisoli]